MIVITIVPTTRHRANRRLLHRCQGINEHVAKYWSMAAKQIHANELNVVTCRKNVRYLQHNNEVHVKSILKPLMKMRVNNPVSS